MKKGILEFKKNVYWRKLLFQFLLSVRIFPFFGRPQILKHLLPFFLLKIIIEKRKTNKNLSKNKNRIIYQNFLNFHSFLNHNNLSFFNNLIFYCQQIEKHDDCDLQNKQIKFNLLLILRTLFTLHAIKR